MSSLPIYYLKIPNSKRIYKMMTHPGSIEECINEEQTEFFLHHPKEEP